MRNILSSTNAFQKEILCGSSITKEKRHLLFGKVAGGSGSRNPEEFQRNKIIEETGIPCPKTNTRIHLRTHKLVAISFPNKQIDGFDYSEDFDGIQTIASCKIFVNLKCIVGKGGSQTRSLREVYWFIEGQLNVLKNTESIENLFFANILDGDEAFCHFSKFEYLVSLPEYKNVKNNIYIGDLKSYMDWFKRLQLNHSTINNL